MTIDRSKMIDSMRRPLTQSLFLEIGYSDDAIYSLKEDDCEYNGKEYKSIKKLYLETADPTEYEFANKYFLNWSHWLRICNNKILAKYVAEWRDELEVKLRSAAYAQVYTQATQGGSYQAAKWLADRGWDIRKAGRPTKEEIEGEKAKQAKIDDIWQADIIRMKNAKGI